jgi:hypothetical protein
MLWHLVVVHQTAASPELSQHWSDLAAENPKATLTFWSQQCLSNTSSLGKRGKLMTLSAKGQKMLECCLKNSV